MEAALITRYKTFEQFAITFNKYSISRYAKKENRDVMINGNYCTLRQIGKIYGEGTPQAWLIIQLTGLSEALGLHTKTTPYQLEAMAEIIYDEWGWLKYTEILQAFRMLMKVDFYGRFDSSTILDAIRRWNHHVRIPSIDAHEKKLQEAKEEQWKRDAVLPPASCLQKMEDAIRSFEDKKKAFQPKVKDQVKSAEMRKKLIEKYGHTH